MKAQKLLTLIMTTILFSTGLSYLYAATTKKNDSFYLSPVENPENIANYPLDNAFLDKIEAVQKDIIAKSVTLTVNDTGNDESATGLITAIKNNFALKTILQQHQLSPENYVTGYMALQAALAAASSLDDKESIFDESVTVSMQNLNFAKTNGDRIRKLLENSL